MLLQGFWAVLGNNCLLILTSENETIQITRHGTLLYLTPQLEPCEKVPQDLLPRFEDYMNELSVDLRNVQAQLDSIQTSDPVVRLEALISTLKPTYYIMLMNGYLMKQIAS